ncbi:MULTISPECIES: phosphate ABC transporter substrate-binding protein PstS [Corynebacterium]|uniref:phosphate ABC transporter substrate-binding protein PstS n=1 Tax=Corynebacterium TaxID=1716 RepID=UPI00082B0FB2|nr:MULTISPECIES: phosphate ABC transporter substrate-binding protein PstS [Corynebacterium]MCI1255081.1 phosphate ABC transporter substrate-binding protein PstS [Corynebacterium provencense]
MTTVKFPAATALAALAAGSLLLTSCSNSGNGGSEAESTSTFDLTNTSGELRGEGASSQQKAMELFGVAYQTAVPGASLAYNATGSGAGQKQFIAGQVDFGGSDSPLKDEQIADAAKRCGGNDAWHLPMVVGPVAVAFKLDGVDTLNLSVDTVAKIFKGEITNWNDPAVAAENQGTTLPDLPISVLYRAEESGTSDNFQKFLTAATDGYWDTEGKTFPTKVGSGAQGSSGVADQVKATNGAITYVESGYATAAGLGIAALDFGSGPVELSTESVNKALAGVKFTGTGNDLVVDSEALFAANEPGAYPLALTTYEIVCSAGYDTETAGRVKDFLHTILDNQNADLEEAGYVPLSGSFRDKLVAAVDALQ